jgi:response regulator of citrate/malate metabolism
MNTLLIIEDDRRVADILKRGLEGAAIFVILQSEIKNLSLQL